MTDAQDTGILLEGIEMWEQYPDGGIICERHGRDPIRPFCAACEIEFELREGA